MTTVREVLSVPAPDLGEALRSTRHTRGLLPLERGVLVNLLGEAAGLLNLKAPDVGQSKPQDLVNTNRKMSTVIDQAIDADFKCMDEAEVRALFAKYNTENGGLPLSCEEPTGDQLQALAAVIKTDRSPYTDFGVWGPFGRRQAKLMKYNASIFAAGEWTTRLMSGPDSFHNWRRCWRVFRTGMLMLGAAKPGPLDEYEETIRALNDVYGSGHWGLIARADDVMRSEEWERTRRRIEDMRSRGVYTLSFDSKTPWAAVLRDSARDTQFWATNVKDLAVMSGSGRNTAVLAAAAGADVAPAGAGHRQHDRSRSPRRQTHDKPGKKGKGAGKGNRRGDRRHTTNSEGSQLCYSWNRTSQGCVSSGPCPNSRAHQCEWCLGPHRAIDSSCPKRPKGWEPSKDKPPHKKSHA